jgi:hypothetical protein
MKRLLISMFALCASLALAHGNHNAEHGGMVRVAGETSFELVTAADGVELYLKDDDGAISSADKSAKLTIVNGSGEKKEVALAPAGGNKFAAKGVQIPSGSRVAVQVTLADNASKIGANFIIK